jgi:hypothetical protein
MSRPQFRHSKWSNSARGGAVLVSLPTIATRQTGHVFTGGGVVEVVILLAPRLASPAAQPHRQGQLSAGSLRSSFREFGVGAIDLYQKPLVEHRIWPIPCLVLGQAAQWVSSEPHVAQCDVAAACIASRRTPLRWTTSMITTAGIITPDRGQRGPHASMAGYRLPHA